MPRLPSSFLEAIAVLDAWMHWLGYGLCHQLPERSFFGGSHQVPVCARDTGIYLGFTVAFAILALVWGRSRPTEMPHWSALAVAAAGVLWMAWDGVTSYAGWRVTTNDLRFATGLATGWAIAVVIFPMLNGELWRRAGRGRGPAGWLGTLLWIAPAPIVFLIVRDAFPFLGIGYPLLVSACILFTFGAVNLVVVTLVPPFERRAERLRDAWLPILLALGLTAAELALTAWLKLVLVGIASRAG